MSPRALVLLMFCLLAVSPRLLRNEHLQEPVTAPQPTPQPGTEYYDALVAKEQQLSSSLQLLNQQIQKLHNTLQNLQGAPQIQIVALEDALADERDILSEMAENHTLPSQVKDVDCANISEGDITVLEGSVKQIENDLRDIEAQIAKLESTLNQTSTNSTNSTNSTANNTLITELYEEAEWVRNYLSHLNKTVQILGKCPTDNTTNSSNSSNGNQTEPTPVYINNINAPNWVYGNMTPAEYYTQALEQINENRNQSCKLTTCPIDKPFVGINGSKECGQCPDDIPVFDVSTGLCRTCLESQGLVFDKVQHTCLPEKIQVNATNNCSNVSGQFFNPETSQCECLPPAVNFNGSACVECPQPSFWNKTSLNCSQCPEATMFFNTSTSKCEACPEWRPFSTGTSCEPCALNEHYDNETGTCKICEANKFYNPIHKQCECREPEPYFNGTACQRCPDYQQYSEKTQTCFQCLPDREYFNRTEGICKQCPESAPVGNKDVCLGCPNDTVFDPKLWICQKCNGTGMLILEVDGKKTCQCPPGTPYLDANQNMCVSCYLPMHWNTTTHKCEDCPKGMIFSEGVCAICPESAPIYNNGRCYPCPNGTHYNDTNGLCVECQKGTIFDQKNKVCYIPECAVDAKWNPDQLKCLSICKGNSTYNPQTKQCECPAQTPFYNGTQCLQCYLPDHWNKDQLKCLPCQKGQYFNDTVGECLFCQNMQQYSEERKRCEPVCTAPQYYNVTINNCSSCPNGLVYSEAQQFCGRCPEGAQMIIDGKCFACPSGSHYDKDRNQCLQCMPGTFYSPVTSECLRDCIGGSSYIQERNRCQCPPSLPYFDGLVCQNCTLPKYWDNKTFSCQYCPPDQYFNNTLLKCTTCPDGYKLTFNNSTPNCTFITPSCPYPTFYDLQTRQCKSCPAGQIYSQQFQNCQVCPKENPIVLNNVCTQCPAPSFFDSEKQQCVQCANDSQVYNPELKACYQKCYGESIFNVTEKACHCPVYRPFYDGTRCVSCYLPKYWDIVSRSCQYCPTEQYFSVEQMQCVYCPEGHKLSRETYQCEKIVPSCVFPMFLNNRTLQCEHCNITDGWAYNLTTKQCQKCPTEQPMIVNFQCAACPNDTFYDPNQKICVKCADGSKYLRDSSRCEPICSGDTILMKDLNKCVCPNIGNKTTYLNTQTYKCVTCDLPLYWDYLSNKCMECQAPYTHYNSTLQQCYTCPYRYKYQPSTNTCLLDETICQYELQQYYNYTLNKCVCPKDKPYFTSSNVCIQCNGLDQYWNADRQICVSCINGQHYDQTQHVCLSCPAGTTFSADKKQCLSMCPAGTRYDNVVNNCVCLDAQAHWNGTVCKTCVGEQFWNDAYKMCSVCPAGTYYNSTTLKCYKCPEGSQYNPEKGLCIQSVTTCVAPRNVYNQYTKSCECPSSTPYYSASQNACRACAVDFDTYWDYNGQRCVDCPSNQHYDASRQACVSCPDQTVYNSNTGLCYAYQPACESAERKYNPVTKQCQCISTTQRFWTGSQCVSCYLPKYWNLDTRTCENCPKGMHYDTSKRACVSCYGGQFFNFTTYTCNSCPAGSNYDINQNKCVVCPAGYVYDAGLQRCLMSTPVSGGGGYVVDPISQPPVAQNTTTPVTRPTTDGFAGVDPISQQPVAGNTGSSTQGSGFTVNPISQPPTTQQTSGSSTSGSSTSGSSTSGSSTSGSSTSGSTSISGSSSTNTSGSSSSSSSTSGSTSTNTNGSSSTTTTTCTTGFFDGSKCVSCYLPRYWNVTDRKCEDCPSGTHYDISVKQCKQCPNSYNTSTFRCQ